MAKTYSEILVEESRELFSGILARALAEAPIYANARMLVVPEAIRGIKRYPEYWELIKEKEEAYCMESI